MATSSKQLFLKLIHQTNRSNVLLALGSNFRSYPSVIHCSTSAESQKQKISKAMKAYLERNLEYDKFLKEQLEEYKMGKQFLASMMGKKGEMTQEDIDEAIEYLFPCGLFVPKSRPIMKPPHEVFSKQKPVQFDNTGRPFHFLFYTGRQNYNQIMHDAATQFQKLNEAYNRVKRTGQEDTLRKLVLVGNWISKDDLEERIIEKIYTIEYTKFIEVFTRLSEHPCAFMAEDFIKKYWVASKVQKEEEIPQPVTAEGGTQVMTTTLSTRKSAVADVTLTYPGTGRIRINNLGLDYFQNIQSREQVNNSFSVRGQSVPGTARPVPRFEWSELGSGLQKAEEATSRV